MEILFTLLAERYEHSSVMITSNVPFSKLETIFKDPMTTAAAIDRLVHHSVILELNIPSYRLEQAQRGQQPTAESPNVKLSSNQESDQPEGPISSSQKKRERGKDRAEL